MTKSDLEDGPASLASAGAADDADRAAIDTASQPVVTERDQALARFGSFQAALSSAYGDVKAAMALLDATPEAEALRAAQPAYIKAEAAHDAAKLEFEKVAS